MTLPSHRVVTRTSLLAVFAVTLAACGDDSTTVGTSSSARPRGHDDVVVQVIVEGGLLPPEVAMGAVPSLTVLGDGTVIRPAPIPDIYPGPAIVPLQSAKVGGAEVDHLVDRARALGLLAGPLQFGHPPVVDAPTTAVTIVADGTTHRHEAYALDVTSDSDLGVGTKALTGDEQKNRRALRSLVAAASELPVGRHEWIPATVAVHDLGPYRPDPQLQQPPKDWPLRHLPVASGERACSVIDGADARILFDALRQANARTPWVVAGAERSLAFRPLVPGQPGCPG